MGINQLEETLRVVRTQIEHYKKELDKEENRKHFVSISVKIHHLKEEEQEILEQLGLKFNQ